MIFLSNFNFFKADFYYLELKFDNFVKIYRITIHVFLCMKDDSCSF